MMISLPLRNTAVVAKRKRWVKTRPRRPRVPVALNRRGRQRLRCGTGSRWTGHVTAQRPRHRPDWGGDRGWGARGQGACRTRVCFWAHFGARPLTSSLDSLSAEVCRPLLLCMPVIRSMERHMAPSPSLTAFAHLAHLSGCVRTP